jgi:predicted dehydrogenase
LLEVARRSRKVALALPYLFNPWSVKIERILQKSTLGRIRMVRCRVAHDANHPRTRWFAQREAAHGGALFDMGVYTAARMVQWFGRVTAVSGLFPSYTGGVDVEQGAAMTVRFASGAVGVLETSWQEIGWKEQVAVYGSKGTLEGSFVYPDVSALQIALKPARRGARARFKPVALPKRIPMPGNVCQHWADCILGRARPLIPISRGRHLVEILCAGYEAVATGREMPVHSRA